MTGSGRPISVFRAAFLALAPPTARQGGRLIVLYPQVAARAAANPLGCWDWWGYTGAQYHTKAGPQLRAVKAMLDRLASPRR